MSRLGRRGMFFHVVSFHAVLCRFVSCRAMPYLSCRGERCRVALCLLFRAARSAACGAVQAPCGSGRFSRRLCGCRMESGQADKIPCGEYGCCAAVRIVRACPDGADAARKGAGRCCRWCGFARDGGPVRRGNDSVQGVRRGRDCEYRLYSLSLPRSAAGKCMAAAFRKDFGP